MTVDWTAGNSEWKLTGVAKSNLYFHSELCYLLKNGYIYYIHCIQENDEEKDSATCYRERQREMAKIRAEIQFLHIV